MYQCYFFNRVLVSNFTEDQLDRYEMYRRAAFPKAAIKRVSKSFITSILYFASLCKVRFSGIYSIHCIPYFRSCKL